jgi:hypothetical protein
MLPSGILFLGLVLASPFPEDTIQIEAESYTDSLNLGGEAVHVVVCESASGGLAVQGVDTAGEWISFPLEVEEPIAFRDSLRSAGALGIVRTHVVEFRAAGSGVLIESDTLVTPPGLGIG